MIPLLFLKLALTIVPEAVAQETFTWTDYGSALVRRTSATGLPTDGGIGRPAVAYDPVADRYVMLFSPTFTPSDPSQYAACTSTFALARAESSDGKTWTVDSSFTIVPPTSTGSYYHCAAAQPTMLYDGATWHVWFLATADTNMFAGSTTFACISGFRATGIGHATSTDGRVFTADANLAVPASAMVANYGVSCGDKNGDGINENEVDVGDIGFPSVTKVDDTWYMAIHKSFRFLPAGWGPFPISGSTGQGVVWASSTNGTTWAVDTTEPRVWHNEAGSSWKADYVSRPSVLCEEDVPARDAFTMFIGGTSLNGTGTADDVYGYARVTANFTDTWTAAPDSPFKIWTTDNRWRQWAPLRVGSDYLVYYVDATNTELRLQHTTPTATWNESLISDNLCDLPDLDGDGFKGAIDDCDDTDANVYPDAPELCDGLDNDCDTTIDEEAIDREDYYADVDLDGFGDLDDTVSACALPVGYVTDNTDCDDNDINVNSDAVEFCNGMDDNCDDDIDENTAADALTWYADADDDTYGDVTAPTEACDAPDGFLADNTDCDDTLNTVNPAAAERCNTVDDDCDDAIDEADAIDQTTWYFDGDSDGFGSPDVQEEACDPSSGYLALAGDCDDANPFISPAGVEIPNNGIDENCDGGDLEVDDTDVSDTDTGSIDTGDSDTDSSDTDDSDAADSDTGAADSDIPCRLGIAGGGGGFCQTRKVQDGKCAWIVLPLLPLLGLRRRRR